jgi:hypothetical protein
MLRQGLPQPSRCYSLKNGFFIDHDGLEFYLAPGSKQAAGQWLAVFGMGTCGSRPEYSFIWLVESRGGHEMPEFRIFFG